MTTQKFDSGRAAGSGGACSILTGGSPERDATRAGRGPGLASARRTLWAVAAAAASLAVGTGTLPAGTISVPNGSFESQVAPNPYVPPYVELRIDSWQKTPKPDSWDETAYGPWDQLIGLFANTPPGDPSHIDNCDGNQAVYLFANPQVGFFQDYDSIDWSSSSPSHAFDANFEAGKSYQLTAGVTISYYRPPTNGATLELSLYYRDAASNQVTVAATSITNTTEIFSNVTHLIDFQVNVPTVSAADAWAGRHIGVAVTSTGDTNLAGGAWDVDNVRLTATRTPVLTGSTVTNGQFGFTLESEPGLGFEILASSNPALTISNWTSVGTVSNYTGSVFFSEPATNVPGRLYRARQLP
jgi:hypothetical protein